MNYLLRRNRMVPVSFFMSLLIAPDKFRNPESLKGRGIGGGDALTFEKDIVPIIR